MLAFTPVFLIKQDSFNWALLLINSWNCLKTVKPRLNVPIVKTPSFKLPAWSDYISNTVNFKWSWRQFANWHTFTLSLVFKIVKMFTHFKPWYLHINEKISMLSPERKQKAPGKWYRVKVYKFQILQKPRILKLYKQPF